MFYIVCQPINKIKLVIVYNIYILFINKIVTEKLTNFIKPLNLKQSYINLHHYIHQSPYSTWLSVPPFHLAQILFDTD